MRARSAWFAGVALFALAGSGCAAAAAGGAGGPHREAIGSSTLFSNVVRTGNLVFTSGVIGRPTDGGGIQSATRQSLDGVRDRLEAAGASMADAVKCTVFLIDIADYGGMNEVYQEYFPSSPPARTALAVRELPAGAQVEIECIAAIR